MVYVNNQKFSCASCIKGHRSSSCYHADRPLFEVKKKGRPVSQCAMCRTLRKSKQLHIKCTCAENLKQSSEIASGSSTSIKAPNRSERKLPPFPIFPNGLSDLNNVSSSSQHPKQAVVNLLNPCMCTSVFACRCARGGSQANVDGYRKRLLTKASQRKSCKTIPNFLSHETNEASKSLPPITSVLALPCSSDVTLPPIAIPDITWNQNEADAGSDVVSKSPTVNCVSKAHSRHKSTKKTSCCSASHAPTNTDSSSSSKDRRQGLGLAVLATGNCCAGHCQCRGGRCGCSQGCGGECEGLHSNQDEKTLLDNIISDHYTPNL